ncbi:hypothetical protein ACFMQL_19900 [Nonomuraea fastidiosa]
MRSKSGFDPYLALIVAVAQTVIARGASWGRPAGGSRSTSAPSRYSRSGR